MQAVGAHTPAKTALSYVDGAGATAVQVFVGNPRGWARPPGDPATDEAFAAGLAARGIPAAPGGMTALLDGLIPGRRRLIHANDSKDLRGSLRDRHETVGKGMIGEPAFTELVNHPATPGVPIIVETPSGKSGDGHATDIALLRGLRKT